MSTRTRCALATLLAVLLLGFGQTVDTARADTTPVRDSRIVAHGARVAPSSTTPSERRAPIAKVGVVAAGAGTASRWVQILGAVASAPIAAALPAANRGRAPPA